MPYLIQRAIATAGLVVLGPLILVLGLAVRVTSPGPAFHRATRVSGNGTFTLYKLRTMRGGAAASGPGITATGDERVTEFGRFLRRTKLDELPQLWNVVCGDMALVGPRPEDPRYVDLTEAIHAEVFGALPGITGPTALAYRDEGDIIDRLAHDRARSQGRSDVTADDIEFVYRQSVLPDKLDSDADYLRRRSWATDIRVLWRTLLGR